MPRHPSPVAGFCRWHGRRALSPQLLLPTVGVELRSFAKKTSNNLGCTTALCCRIDGDTGVYWSQHFNSCSLNPPAMSPKVGPQTRGLHPRLGQVTCCAQVFAASSLSARACKQPFWFLMWSESVLPDTSIEQGKVVVWMESNMLHAHKDLCVANSKKEVIFDKYTLLFNYDKDVILPQLSIHQNVTRTRGEVRTCKRNWRGLSRVLETAWAWFLTQLGVPETSCRYNPHNPQVPVAAVTPPECDHRCLNAGFRLSFIARPQ